MRIACISASSVPSRSANSIQVMKVCQSLVELGHSVRLLLPGETPEVRWSELEEHYGLRARFPIHWLRAFRGLRRYDFALRAVWHGLRWSADLFYIWNYQSAALASVLGLPTLLEMHDRPYGRFAPQLFRLYLKGRGSRRLLCTTEALRLWLEDAYAVQLRPPFTILSPNGVDLECYEGLPDPQEARRQLDLPQRFTACYTGHLYSGRGAGLMLELARRHGDLSFVWAGGEPGAIHSWRERLTAEGVSNVTLLGFLPHKQVPGLHAAGDVLLMPYGRKIRVSSGDETSAFACPMKIFEYLAAGRPILSSDLPVFREVLNERNAILLPPEDVDAWDQALEGLIADPERRTALGRQSREDAHRYAWEARARSALSGLGAGLDD